MALRAQLRDTQAHVHSMREELVAARAKIQSVEKLNQDLQE